MKTPWIELVRPVTSTSTAGGCVLSQSPYCLVTVFQSSFTPPTSILLELVGFGNKELRGQPQELDRLVRDVQQATAAPGMTTALILFVCLRYEQPPPLISALRVHLLWVMSMQVLMAVETEC